MFCPKGARSGANVVAFENLNFDIVQMALQGHCLAAELRRQRFGERDADELVGLLQKRLDSAPVLAAGGATKRLVLSLELLDPRVQFILGRTAHGLLFLLNARESVPQRLHEQALGIGGGEQVVLQCVHDLLSLCLVDREQRGRALHGIERDFGSQRQAQKKVGSLVWVGLREPFLEVEDPPPAQQIGPGMVPGPTTSGRAGRPGLWHIMCHRLCHSRGRLSHMSRFSAVRGSDFIRFSGKPGWGGRIRTYGTRYQKPLPYHLATPQQVWRLSNLVGWRLQEPDAGFLWLPPGHFSTSAGRAGAGRDAARAAGDQRRIGSVLARRSKPMSVATSFGICDSGTMFGPSEGAVSGASWVSMNTAAMPSETAARAITGANSR